MNRHVGIIGMGAMGTVAARRLSRKGFPLSLYNRHVEGQEENMAQTAIAQHPELVSSLGFEDIISFISSLVAPRVIFLFVKAGDAVEENLNALLPLLGPEDVIIDAGNSHYEDTARRVAQCEAAGVHFLGCGLSGGLDGIGIGFSVMAGGSRAAYELAAVPLYALAAISVKGSACCAYVGDGGAGHFVKIVHNGIEYAEMQLLSEVYGLLRWAVDFHPDAIADILEQWKTTQANGYLLEITPNILREKKDGVWVIDHILDSAGHKGTGVWAVQAAASFGIPTMMITAALHARYLSGQRHVRKHLDDVSAAQYKKDPSVSTNDLFNALQIGRFINYHEGFAIIRSASRHFGWNISLTDLTRIWTNGCIIRSDLMNQFVKLWEEWDDELILYPEVKEIIMSGWSGLRRIIQVASSETIFTPCLVAASQYIAGSSLRHPTANLIQAQRDYFGNHGFLDVDDPFGALQHYPWKRE